MNVVAIMATEEIWKPIVGFEGLYEISSFGNIKSLQRLTYYSDGRVFNQPEIIKSVRKQKDGYVMVTLSKETKKFNIRVHNLVADHFIPKEEGRNCINHKDGNKSNNSISNLERCTYKENSLHAVKTGLIKQGKESPHSKLKESDILEIRKIYVENNETMERIGSRFGISFQNVSQIINRKTWKNV